MQRQYRRLWPSYEISFLRQNRQFQSLGVAAANFAMESELLLNRAGTLYFFELY